jgi:hypothetical protein
MNCRPRQIEQGAHRGSEIGALSGYQALRDTRAAIRGSGGMVNGPQMDHRNPVNRSERTCTNATKNVDSN